MCPRVDDNPTNSIISINSLFFQVFLLRRGFVEIARSRLVWRLRMWRSHRLLWWKWISSRITNYPRALYLAINCFLSWISWFAIKTDSDSLFMQAKLLWIINSEAALIIVCEIGKLFVQSVLRTRVLFWFELNWKWSVFR